ncbi:CynX/NimT family MFS transporter [Oceanobacillus senegalensis]|uniref:CynX/NimT family MFS transporter n=1 Tax=Oceanobacillus senegalensis TaxID=1936063 RepID=UPI000A305AFF|nr:MFS transporter [Oceanobacillus senegalensis]
MDLDQDAKQRNKAYHILLITGVILLAFNLRPAITSVGPIIGFIRDDMGLTNGSAGLLTSLPLIAFAIMSPIAPKLGNRFSNEWAMFIGLILLFIGITVRSTSIWILLFAGTLLVGLGIAIINVLLPSLIKGKFPKRVGLMTSVYTTAMGIFAATASGLSVPIASGLNLGWQVALLVWAIPTVVALFICFYLARKDPLHKNQMENKFVKASGQRMWRSPLAWQVALFMGFQSFLFYVTISWLPEILHSYGTSMTTAGWLLSFTQFIGLPASFLVPMLAERFRSQQGIVLALGLCAIGGYGGLLLGNSTVTMIISIILIGITLAGAFALALTFLGLRAQTAKEAAELSGMAQTLGYILAATGPIIIGFLFDLTQTWAVPLITILIVTVLVITFGLGAGRNKYV